MNFKNWLLTEMPIANLTKVGDWSSNAKRNYGFDKKDAAILGSEKGIQRLYRKWSNSKYDFDLYFVRTKWAYKHSEVGEVTSDWVRENLKEDIQPREDAITVIFTNNTGDEKVAATPWTLAHRLGHVIRRDKTFEEHFSKEVQRDFIGLLKDVYGVQKQSKYYSYWGQLTAEYEKELKGFMQAVGTMRSARQMNLRNASEFIYELVAQWITTGDIKFNPLPREFILRKRMAWGRPNHDKIWTRISNEDWTDWNYQLENMADKYTYNLDSIFSGLVGKMYVM